MELDICGKMVCVQESIEALLERWGKGNHEISFVDWLKGEK
jgi:hypothetical protein